MLVDVSGSITEQYKTLEMCDRLVSQEPFILIHC